VLKAAWRREVHAHGLCLVQAVEQECPTGSVYALTDDTSRVDDLWDRYQAARNQIGDSTRLEVVA
jgi:hypothetical protein